MGSAISEISQWRDRLRARLPAPLAVLLGGISTRELLKQTNLTLLVFNDTLCNLKTGDLAKLDPDTDSAQALAQAARRLVSPGQPQTSILLLLPPSEFVATPVSMPGLARDTVISALRLQTDNLLPSLEQTMAVAINPMASQPGQQDVALWIRESRLDRLFDEFAAQGLFLAAVMPRPLCLAPASGVLNLLDEDQQCLTSVTISHGAIHEWLHIRKSELEQEVFREQWQQANQPAAALDQVAVSRVEEFGPAATDPILPHYGVFPRGALAARRRVEKSKRLSMAAMAAVVVLLLSAIPFLAQSIQMGRLEASLAAQRELSQGPREDRQAVQAFEDDWGPLVDFPNQNVRLTLFNLQNILSPERLSSFELSEGLISIEGESAEPQNILQRLEQDSMFTEVAFARATNNSRYYIGLRLSTVNFEGYLVRHFPDN